MTVAASPRLGPTGRGILLMLAGIVCFTLLDAVAKDLTGRYPVLQVLWARIALQLLLVVLILRAAVRRHIVTASPGLHVARALTQLGAGAFFFAALPHIGLAEATALADLNPVLVTLGAALLLGERLGPRRIAAVAVALFGGLIIIRPGVGVFTPAALLPLGCAVCYAANSLLTRAVGMRDGVWTAMLWTSLVATAVCSLGLPFVAVPVAAGDLWRFAAIGALGTLAQLCVIRSLSLAEASVTAPFTYFGILMATVWGMVFFGEWPDAATVVGALVIVGSGLYVWHRETAGRNG
jgi:drug/metabolite transporter (DMT)-like permease